MTGPMTDLDKAVERLTGERDGYRVAAEIERGVMWALEPYTDQWHKLRDDKQNDGLLTRFVMEQNSSRSNERRSRETADAIDTVLSALSAQSAELAKAREALGPFGHFYNDKLSGLSDGIEVRIDASFDVQGIEAHRCGGIRLDAQTKTNVGAFHAAAQIINRQALGETK